MTNKNTLRLSGFLIGNLAGIAWVYIMYNMIFFRCLPEQTLTNSRLFLGGLILLLSGIGIGVTVGKRRNSLSIAINSLLPFVVYWFCTYAQDYPMIAELVLMLTGILTAGYFLLSMGLYCYERLAKRRAVTVNKAFWMSLLNCRTIGVLCLTLVFLPGLSNLFGIPLLQSTTEAVAPEMVTEELTVVNNADALAIFGDDAWQQASTQERLDAPQLVANLEAAHLGIPHELNVCSGVLDENVLGYYSAKDRSVHIAIDHLNDSHPLQVLNTVLHECRHGYQRAFAELYKGLSAEQQRLCVFQDAAQYSMEFSNYIDGNQDYEGYRQHACETGARDYASQRISVYLQNIACYRELLNLESES